MYESCSSLLYSNLDSDEVIKFVCNYMIRRAKTILHILENPVLSLKDSKECWNKMLSFDISKIEQTFSQQK